LAVLAARIGASDYRAARSDKNDPSNIYIWRPGVAQRALRAGRSSFGRVPDRFGLLNDRTNVISNPPGIWGRGIAVRNACLTFAVVLAVSGCLSAPKPPPQEIKSAPDIEKFGVQIIRPGMTDAEVCKILGPWGLSTSCLTAPTNWHGNLHVHYSSPLGKVKSCRSPDITITAIRATLSDDELTECLKPGMGPKEVEQLVGVAKCGYENEPGTVVLVYPQPGIEVVYVDQGLKSWRRTHTYWLVEPGVAKPGPGDLATYGVYLIRPGMSPDEVEHLLGTQSKIERCTGQFHVYSVAYGPNGPTVDYEFGKGVVRCSTASQSTITGLGETVTDSELEVLLYQGIKLREVEQRIGLPKYGYENEPGTVVLIYSQPGIEVVFEKSQIKSWRRTHTSQPTDSAAKSESGAK
jgi:hypothetical protein